MRGARPELPASLETVAAFLAVEARNALAVNTLRLRHAAIRYMHLLAGAPPPTAAATFAGIRRAHRRPLDKKTALVLDRLLPAILAIPDNLPGLRDRALLLVGFAAALRPRDCRAHIRAPDAPRRRHRAVSAVAQKRPGRPRHQTLAAPGQHRTLPGQRARGLARRRDYRRPAVPPPISAAARGVRSKPAFERYRLGCAPIDADSIALIVKRWTGLAGFDGAGFAGHSLGRRAISSGVAAGVHIARLKQLSGHALLKSPEEYVELDELRHNHPLKDVL